jgi:hypothetical protein
VERLANVPVPLYVDGTLSKLSFTPDVVSTAIGAAKSFGTEKLGEQADAVASLLGVKEDGPVPDCAQAEAQAQGRAPAPAPAPASAESPAQEKTKEAVRSIEKGLKSLFGR